MWARLQGVGISVRADTALPWPLLLLHKASQPALSPGLESVSAATCQIQTKKGEKNKQTTTQSLPSYPYVTSHPSPPLTPPSFASSLIIAAPVGRQSHNLLLNMPASLANRVCHSLCHLFSSRATYRHKSVSIE